MGDFLRIFPPTEKCPQSIALEYLSIIRSLSGVYKPITCKSSRVSVTGWTGLEQTMTGHMTGVQNKNQVQSPGLRRSTSAIVFDLSKLDGPGKPTETDGPGLRRSASAARERPGEQKERKDDYV